MVYNPHSKTYYEPDSYRFDSYRLPGLMYPDVKYNRGLFCCLLWDDNPSMEEKYTAGTWVECLDPSTNILLAGTVMYIPFSGVFLESCDAPLYTILFDNGTISSVLLSEMASLIPSPPVHDDINAGSQALLPPFLQSISKITYKHDGQFHKGFLGIKNGVYCFISNHMSTSVRKTGAPINPISLRIGSICVLKVS